MHSSITTAVIFVFFNHFAVSYGWKCSTCSINYKAIGCYQDDHHRTLPKEILNERDPSRKINEGNVINWMQWDTYIEEFACRCAAKAKERGWRVFGLQFYGECWSGPDLHSYKKLGPSDKCIGIGYKKCGPFDRHCVGEQFTNMVYEIVPECEVKFERLGCNNDPHITPRPLPDYILTDRDSSHKVSSGKSVDWRNWDAYVPEFACRCAKKAKERGDNTFGLQYYGECFSGSHAEHTYNNNGPSSNCVDPCFESCKRYSKYCIGKQFTNFVYKLSDAPCEIGLEEVGCFKENPLNRALDKELLNQVNPASPLFKGDLLDSRNWNEEFPKLLCRCARIAKEGGFTMFGVISGGSCWSGTLAGASHKIHGKSNECFTNHNAPCKPGELKCAGGSSAHFVYKIKTGNARRHYIPRRYDYKYKNYKA